MILDFSEGILSMYPNVAKSGGLQIPRCQWFAVDDYGFTLGALTLKPSDFCNIGVMLTDKHHKRIVNLFSIEVWLLFNLIFMIKLEL
jgi:hypothetical protein